MPGRLVSFAGPNFECGFGRGDLKARRSTGRLEQLVNRRLPGGSVAHPLTEVQGGEFLVRKIGKKRIIERKKKKIKGN